MSARNLKASPGVAITTGGVFVYANPADSGFREIVQITFNNIDGVNDAALYGVEWYDYSAAGVGQRILPVNVKVPKLDSVTITKIFDLGDSVSAWASANGDIVAIVDVIGRESITAPFPQLASPPGVAVLTTATTIYTNPISSGVREIVQITFNNIDGVNDAALTNCLFIDASLSFAGITVLPIGVKVPKGDNITLTKVLDPGDVIQAFASAAGDIVAIVEILGREPV